MIRNPVFAKEEVERIRRQTLDQLRLALEAPGTLARFAAMRVALGQSPYAHPDAGTLASLTRMQRKDIIALHHREYRPSNMLFVVSGPLPAEEIFALAEKVFGDWREASCRRHPAVSDVALRSFRTTPRKPRSVLIDMPNAGQAAVFLACSSIPRTASDYYAGKVANALLGGGYSSRLNQEVRVKRGLSYGAGSALDTHRSSGLFLASAQTKNESAAEVVNVMRTEVARLGLGAAPADYLRTRKAVLTGAFARDLETNEGYVKRLGELALYGLPLDTMEKTVANIEAVDAEALRAFSERHLPASALSVVVAGNAKQAAEPLRKLIPEIEVIPQAALDFDSNFAAKSWAQIKRLREATHISRYSLHKFPPAPQSRSRPILARGGNRIPAMRMLENLIIKNFKSIRDQTLALGSLNIFIGGNGAGKSN